MIHVHSLEELRLDRDAVLTIGAFDGVHLGHQRLIGAMAAVAHARGRLAAVITFYPHPSVVLRGRRPAFYINTPEEKAALLGRLGVDVVVTHPFSRQVSQIRAADFVDRLVRHARMVELWAGPDFALGHKREGNIAFLQARGAVQGFTVRVIEPTVVEGQVGSSTRVRAALEAGDVTLAARLLGRPFRLPGEVVRGVGRGRTLGFPTANLKIWEERACPGFGVYACWAYVGDDAVRYPAATSIGVRPTFDGEGATPTVEAYLLDFSDDLYGERLALDFIARLRPEQKFPGAEALIEQMRRDVEATREILAAVEMNW